MNLQYQLEGSENRISTERNEYNEAVKAYNTKIKQFPGNIVAGFGGFTEAPYFEADEDAKTVPEVDFSK
jgi:LemA protein